MRAEALLALAACAAACSGEPPAEERAGVAQQAIQGGAVEPGLPGVGMLEFSTGNFGSGTLITPRVVLTAGHVVGGNIQGFYTGAGKAIARGPDVSASQAMTKHAIGAKITHPSYECKTGCDAYPVSLDIGLVLLDAPASEYVPTPLGGGSLAPGLACSTTGYGNHVLDWNAPDAAPFVKQKRTAAVEIVSFADEVVEVGWKTGIADHGDSGGPLFCNGALVGTTAYHTDGDGDAHRVEFYTRVDAALPWIREQLRAWGDTTLETPEVVADAGASADAAVVPPEAPVTAAPGPADGGGSAGCAAARGPRVREDELAWVGMLGLGLLLARRRR